MAEEDGPTMLGVYGAWATGLVHEGPGPLSYRGASWDNVDRWRERARWRLSELLARPNGLPAVPRTRRLRTYTLGDLEGEVLEWDLGYGPPTHGVLLKPAGTHGPLPGVLALHDHGGNKYFGASKISATDRPPHPVVVELRRVCYGGRAWANELARRGFVVLANDAFLFGSRRARPWDLPAGVVEGMVGKDGLKRMAGIADDAEDTTSTVDQVRAYDAFATAHETTVAKSLFSAGTTWPGVFLAEDQAALSVLCARPDVDPARVGCCGLSGGGLRSTFLAALDDRIACSVTAGWMTTWRDLALNKCWTHTWMAYVPGLPPLMDLPEILSLRLPRPTLVQHSRHDPLFTLGEVERCDHILSECWAKAGAPESYRMTYYDGPHKFDVPMQEEAYAWLRGWLT